MTLNAGVPLTTAMVTNCDNVKRRPIVRAPGLLVNLDTVDVDAKGPNNILRHIAGQKMGNVIRLIKMEAGVGIEPA